MIKKFLLAAATALALVGPAQAQSFSSSSNVLSSGSFFSVINAATPGGAFTYNSSFQATLNGAYEVIGAVFGLNLLINSVTINGQAPDLLAANSAFFDYTGTGTGVTNFNISVTGNVLGTTGMLAGGAMVSAVPEPESIAMMLAGLGIIAAVVRRRTRSAGLSAPVAA